MAPCYHGNQAIHDSNIEHKHYDPWTVSLQCKRFFSQNSTYPTLDMYTIMESNQSPILLMIPQYCCYDIYNLSNTFMKTKAMNLTISLTLHEIHPEGPK